MMKEDALVKTFRITESIDNIPVFLNDINEIISNFEFAMRLDPYLFIQLLSCSNNPNYGFSGEIMRIEEIPLLLENDILKALLKSNSKLEINRDWYKEAVFSFILYPVYLSISESLMAPDWLSELDLNNMTMMPTGLLLKKVFFGEEYEKTKRLSIVKNISLLEAELELNYPSMILLSNIYFSIKKIPLIIPYYFKIRKLETVNERINFIITLTDLFLQSGFFCKAGRDNNISSYLDMLPEKLAFEDWYRSFNDKKDLLWKHLIDKRLSDTLNDTVNYCYNYHRSGK